MQSSYLLLLCDWCINEHLMGLIKLDDINLLLWHIEEGLKMKIVGRLFIIWGGRGIGGFGCHAHHFSFTPPLFVSYSIFLCRCTTSPSHKLINLLVNFLASGLREDSGVRFLFFSFSFLKYFFLHKTFMVSKSFAIFSKNSIGYFGTLD